MAKEISAKLRLVNDVTGMSFVINKDAVEGDLDRINIG